MIYTIKNGCLIPLVDRNGKQYKTTTKADKRKHTKRSKRSHRYYDFYNSTAWHRLSYKIRKREPLCRICWREYKVGKRKLGNVNISSSVDHIVPLKQSWPKRLDPSNLQSICHYHHRLKNDNNL